MEDIILLAKLKFLKKGYKKIENNHNKDIGKLGEDIATQYLQKKNYKILARNYNTYQGEIDIIAKDEDEYVFVEVKTRTTSLFGRPVEAVDLKKKNHLLKATEYFVYKNRLNNDLIRFDIIEVYIKENTSFINHLKNIFG